MQSVSDQAVGAGLIRGVRPDQQLVKVAMSIKHLSYRIIQVPLYHLPSRCVSDADCA